MTGVDHQSCGFVDYEQIGVFIYDLQRDILRRDGIVMGLMIQQHLNDIARFDAVIGRHRLAVHPHITGIRSGLDAVAAGVGHMLREIFVNPLLALPLVDLAAPALKDLLLLYVKFLFFHLLPF